jgi:hypothetical protein
MLLAWFLLDHELRVGKTLAFREGKAVGFSIPLQNIGLRFDLKRIYKMAVTK